MQRRRAFSLVELVIVVVIVGILAAIAIPRFSRGAAGASENALVGNLAVLRNAIELYAAEHDGDFPTQANFVNQLTQFTDASGAHSSSKTATHVYGPYLREVPELPTGTHKGSTGVAATSGQPSAENSTDGIGWLYDQSTGQIWANSADFLTE